jgi:hypothetical protein
MKQSQVMPLNPRHPRLRSFAKNLLNPLVLKFAGARFSPIAVIRHVGRRSGQPYTTPMIVRRYGEGFLIALTMGRMWTGIAILRQREAVGCYGRGESSPSASLRR